MSSTEAGWDSLAKTFLLLLVDNLGATGKLRSNSSPVKVKLIIYPLFLPEGNAILPITPMAVCETPPDHYRCEKCTKVSESKNKLHLHIMETHKEMRLKKRH